MYSDICIVFNRTTRWLDRCLKAHGNPAAQNIFPIVQGTLFEDLRRQSANDLIQRNVRGYAIGGLRYNYNIKLYFIV